MKKFLREYAANLVVSLVVAFIAFGASTSWGWPFAGSVAFAIVAGLITAVVIQGLVVLWHRNRSVPEEGRPGGGGTTAEKAAGADTAADEGGGLSGSNPGGDDGSASGTGAAESGPRGPVQRSEGYRSSLEDPG
ncbi:magnesium transporter [Arthrobacter castelli]|uniref:magnesium transporter n=1 Tax=Arthrobacter castelli TaxID=271431 RepID=UPI00040197D2|nr:magnesium transporter [Arthrobacter castelli]